MNGAGTETTKKRKRNRIYHVFYAVMAAAFLVMLIWAATANRGQSPTGLLSEGNIPFDEGWYLEDGSAADMEHLHKMSSVRPYREQSVYHSLPSDLGEGKSLCFRTKNISYQV
ncbi:MAG: hypothetical protein K2I53_15785, partial [Lachnospiraceae bacterium]|nr:hypothetical protein [Lachnospiraceae bacterium]